MNNRLIFLLIIAFTLCHLWLLAQGGIQEDEKAIIDGKQYYIHIIQEGETYDFLTKKYGTSKRELNRYNKILLTGLKPGFAIKIPVLSPKEKSTGAKFIYHKVEKHQTLYYLTKRYDITLEEILKFNPDARKGIKRGQIILIPNANIASEEQVKDSTQYVLHTVSEDENLKTIALHYNVTEDTIRQCNPEIIWDVTEGMEIKIPMVDGTMMIDDAIFDESLFFVEEVPLYLKQPCDSYSYNYNDEFDIALLLPFEHNSTKHNLNDTTINAIAENTRRFYRMYEGMLLAVEDYRQKGLSVNLHIHDTEKNEDKVNSLVTDSVLNDMDLIIGPAYTSNVKNVADLAREKKINMVSPLSAKSELLSFNPFLFQAKPSDETMYAELTRYLAKFYNQNFIVLHNYTNPELEEIEVFKKHLVNAISENNAVEAVVYKEINCKHKGLNAIETSLSTTMENIIFIPSLKEPFVADVLTKLHTLTDKYRIFVVGMPNWKYFNSIELEYFHQLQVHYFDSYFIDYESIKIKNFIIKYRDVFKADPDYLSFHGYDLMSYFLSVLMNYGPRFQFCISAFHLIPKYEGLQTGFDFQRSENGGGFENMHVNILRFTPDFNITKVNISERNYYFEDWSYK